MAKPLDVVLKFLGADVSTSNRLPVDNGQVQSLTDTQLRANAIGVEDQSGRNPSLARLPERAVRGVVGLNTGYILFDASGYSAMSVTISSNTNNPKIFIETSGDGIYWGGVQPVSLSSTPSNLSSAGFVAPNGTNTYQIARPGRFVRISQISSGTYTGIQVVLYQGSVTPKQQEINLPTSSTWSYVAASGGAIINTTPIALCAATNISYTNVLLDIDIFNSGATDTEVIIRSNLTVGGASPTFIWRTWVKAGTGLTKTFRPGIKAISGIGAAGGGQLIEVISSVSTTLYVNAQGTVISS